MTWTRSVLGAELRIHSVESMREGSIFIFSHSIRDERTDTVAPRTQFDAEERNGPFDLV